jgi:hypothetical protein
MAPILSQVFSDSMNVNDRNEDIELHIDDVTRYKINGDPIERPQAEQHRLLGAGMHND